MVPIPGTRRIERLEENVQAVALTPTLTLEEIDRLDRLVPRGAAGARYPESGMRTIDR